jgi:hypothetical protein
MLHYDGLYEQLARYADPLSLEEQTRGLAGEKICLGDCFSGRGDQLRLDEGHYRDFIRLEILERLPVAMTPVLAEVIADVAEFKFAELQPNRANDLLSSSYLDTFPSKLDLILQDVPYYFQQATKVFRLFASLPSRQQRVQRELIDLGASPEAAHTACDRMVAIWQELAEHTYSPRLQWRTERDQLAVNMVSRLGLNFLGIHRAKIETCQRIRDLGVGELPLKSFRDLLLISSAVFFEADPPRNLWRVDEFVSLRVEAFCERLASDVQC